MPQYPIAPWFSQGADPAAHYQTGLQIGARIGAEQAAQQYQQQQLLREQQKDEFDKQYKTAVLQMQVDEVTQKHRAMSDYQSMIAQGVDPMTALRRVGPQMGVSPDRIEQIDALRGYRQQQEADRKQQLQNEAARITETQRHNAANEAAAFKRATEQAAATKINQQMRQAALTQKTRSEAEKALIKDPEYLTLQGNLNSAQRKLNERIAKGKGLFGSDESLAADVQRLTTQVAEAKKAVDRRRNEFVASLPPQAFTPAESDTGEETGVQGNDSEEETVPSTTESPAAPKRLRWDIEQGKLVE